MYHHSETIYPAWKGVYMDIQIETLIAHVESLQKGLGQVHDALVALGRGGQPLVHKAALRDRPVAHDARAADVLKRVAELTRGGPKKAGQLHEGLALMLPEITSPRALSSWLDPLVDQSILVAGCEHTLRRTHRGAFNFYTVEGVSKDGGQPSVDGQVVGVLKIIGTQTRRVKMRASDLLPHLQILVPAGNHHALAAWLKEHLVARKFRIEDGVVGELVAVLDKGTTFYSVRFEGGKKPTELRQLYLKEEAERAAQAAKRKADLAVEMAKSQRWQSDKWPGAVRRMLADFLAKSPEAEVPLRLQVSSGALKQDLREVLSLALADLDAAAKPRPAATYAGEQGNLARNGVGSNMTEEERHQIEEDLPF